MSYVSFLLPVENYTLANQTPPMQISLILVLYDIYDHFMGEEPVGIAFMLPSTQSQVSFVLHFSTLIALPLLKYNMFAF